MTSLTIERDWVDPVTTVSGLFKTFGLIIVLAAVTAVCTAKLQSLTDARDAQGQEYVSAQDRIRQLSCLTKNIYWEASGEPFEGKVGVAQVTVNRLDSGKFANSICEVVHQKNIFYEKVVCQFSWVCENNHKVRPVNPKAWAESETVAKMVLLENFRLPSLTQSLFFHATSVQPGWNKEKLIVVGNHIFYK